MNDDLLARADSFKVAVDGKSRLICDLAAALREARAERDQLRAARIAYASEFPLNSDGEPDIGNVHANIRALKAERDRANADAARYRWLKDNARRIDFAGLCVSDMGQLDARIDAHLRGEGEGRTPETQPLPAEEMCPNCVTPWKCNGPHRPLRGKKEI